MARISQLISRFKDSEVKQIFKTARLKEKVMGLEFFLAPSLLDYGKILVVTPKKSGNAPDRNLIRRRAKAIFYENKLFENKVNCLLIVRKEGINTDFDTLKKLLLDIFDEYKRKIS